MIKNRLSVQVLTYNEASRIRDCLESVVWADEVLVVDAGSSDGTVEICREYPNVRLVQREWAGYADQRRFALSQTNAEWILIVDADERISSGLREEIMAKTVSARPEVSGYRLPRRFYIAGRLVREVGHERLIRLFRRERGRIQPRLVHESVQLDGRVEDLRGFLEHHSYGGFGHMIDKYREYAGLAARQMELGKKSVSAAAVILHPVLAFLRLYLFHGRFLGGMDGLVSSILFSIYVFNKYVLFWESQRRSDARDLNNRGHL